MHLNKIIKVYEEECGRRGVNPCKKGGFKIINNK